MGKVTFEYDDIEEQEAIQTHLNAWKVNAAIEEYNNYLRSRLKHEELTDEVYHALDRARAKLHDLLREE